MAIIPEDEFPGKILPASAEYPLGKARNITLPEDNTGTPLTANLINDFWGFFQALLAQEGITASGSPDEVGDSQYLDALNALVLSSTGSVAQTIYPVGSIYTSTLETNPSVILGFGTWVVFGPGKVLVGIDSTDTDFDAIEETGGSKVTSKDGWGSTQTAGKLPTPTVDGRLITGSGLSELVEGLEGIAEADTDLSNVQPYIVISMWKRTA